MDPITIVAVLNGALSLAGDILPMIDQYAAEGKITPEQQTAVRAAYDSLRTKADGQFSGPQWAQSGQS